MNIKQAKDYIENTVRLYLKKNEFGEYRIPVVRQRPVFLLGAPGIGKTAVMEQIAQELSVALVSYSMTHHTRQSALGLPFISHKEYEGMQYDVSEYTMSEIIASIYEVMEESGIKEGILFLDEINCVSETLAPSMLQFLQYKVFGRHRVPEGWVIVTAGNPPEYNKSVREFDVVTMDRLKVLSVDADYQVWKEYAQERGLHTAILNFLELKKEYFYKIETTVNGRNYVTARGWEDLSEILKLYEEEGMKADESLIGQYLHNDRIVREFAAYYDLFNKYKKEYQTEEILNGTVSEQTVERARVAAFDERLSLLGMLMDKVMSEIRENMETSDYLAELFKGLKAIKTVTEKDDGAKAGADNVSGSGAAAAIPSVESMLDKQAQGRRKQMDSMLKAGNLSEEERRKNNRIIRFMAQAQKAVYMESQLSPREAFQIVKDKFEGELSDMKQETMKIKERLENLFAFVQSAFSEGNEMLILVTELTVNHNSARFISRFGCDAYQKHNEQLMLSERRNLLQEEIAALDL
ncbi:MAG: AAA family ATPase [Lachnospiraceae bacterium]|nr:AAA family ATPase [Lachnospiraceae bacterium]